MAKQRGWFPLIRKPALLISIIVGQNSVVWPPRKLLLVRPCSPPGSYVLKKPPGPVAYVATLVPRESVLVTASSRARLKPGTAKLIPRRSVNKPLMVARRSLGEKIPKKMRTYEI